MYHKTAFMVDKQCYPRHWSVALELIFLVKYAVLYTVHACIYFTNLSLRSWRINQSIRIPVIPELHEAP